MQNTAIELVKDAPVAGPSETVSVFQAELTAREVAKESDVGRTAIVINVGAQQRSRLTVT